MNHPSKKVDYSQTRRVQSADEGKVEAIVQELEQLMVTVRKEYELWQSGSSPRPPHALRSQLDARIRQVQTKPPEQTAAAFRLNNMLQKYRTLAAQWDRAQRQREGA